jgi:DNA-binding CsgD family transcriptional regulator
MDAFRPPRLEPLERLALELAAEGLSTTDISERLGVPVDRVRAHTLAVIGKLGARSKLEALIIAIRLGLISPQST